MGYLAVLLRLRFSFFFCNSRPILFRVFRRVLNHIPCDPSWYKMGRDWLHRRRLTSSITEPLREKVDDCRRAVDSFTATRNDDDTFNDPVPSLDAANTRKNEPKKSNSYNKKKHRFHIESPDFEKYFWIRRHNWLTKNYEITNSKKTRSSKYVNLHYRWVH